MAYQARRGGERPKSRCACCLAFALGIVGLMIGLWIALNAFHQNMVDAEIAKLKAAGKPVTGLDLAPPPVSDDLNAASLYLQAADIAEPKGSNTGGWQYTDADWTDPADIARLTRFVNERKEALKLLRQATARPHARFDVDWSNPVTALFPHYSRLRSNARFVSAAAVVSAHGGDQAEALERLQIGFTATRHMRDDAPGTIGLLVGVAVDAITLRAAEHVMKQGPPPEAEARALAEDLLKMDFHEWYRDTAAAERVFGLAYFDMMETNPEDFIGEDAPLMAIETHIPMWRCADEMQFLEAMATYEQWASDPLRVRRQQPASIPQAPSWAMLTNMMTPTYSRAGTKAELEESRRRLFATALGVEVYKQKRGTYPQGLADLKAIDWPPCEDSLTGKEFIYERKGDVYRLYGVGSNCQDDGGTAPVQRKDLNDGGPYDLVWGAEYQK